MSNKPTEKELKKHQDFADKTCFKTQDLISRLQIIIDKSKYVRDNYYSNHYKDVKKLYEESLKLIWLMELYQILLYQKLEKLT